MTAYMTPALSTVNIPVRDMTRYAIEQAIRLANHESPYQMPLFHGELVLRESTRPPQV